jgi:hypothetical protein
MFLHVLASKGHLQFFGSWRHQLQIQQWRIFKCILPSACYAQFLFLLSSYLHMNPVTLFVYKVICNYIDPIQMTQDNFPNWRFIYLPLQRLVHPLMQHRQGLRIWKWTSWGETFFAYHKYTLLTNFWQSTSM